MEYEKSLTVAAEPAEVWEVLSDIERWPERITTYEEVRRLDDGDLRVGSRARVKQKGLKAGDWEVSELVEDRAFTWSSRQPGVQIVGRHTVSTDPDGRTRLTLVLQQSGWLSGLVAMALGRKVREYVDLEAEALKAAAEAA
jgi:carbon monoxide dehydrogenase subunit G